MKSDKLQRQLDAGGWVPVDSKCDLTTTEAIVARTYVAPPLGDRIVVKLSSDRLVEAEDLAMDYLGLKPHAISPPLARQHRTAIDFAHWALINQPKQARYALDLVKRMKGAERKAASKPGHAWDAYSEMADELNKSVRHFLPAFWEQAARSFKNLGNMTYAGRALNKALEAERIHALDIDREHRRDAVLEFSLSGCLSGKALSDYSKDLSSQFPPQEAYDTYRDLLIRRTLGGMPPTGNAGSDLIRLAKAANLDIDQEVESFLEAIISSPAMVRAPVQFWKSVQKQVGNIAKRSDAFCMWLLVHTSPAPRYTGDSLVWAWLDLLRDWNVLPLLWRPAKELPKDVEIPGGRAGWITRLVTVETSPHQWAFELLEKMADVLKTEGQPLELHRGQSWQNWVDVDTLEACLQLGIPVSDETANCEPEFSGWLRETIDHPRRNSQLTAIEADTRFAHRLVDAMPQLVVFRGESTKSRNSYGRNVASRRAFEAAAVDHPVIKKLWWQYLDQQLKECEQGGLMQLEKSLANLNKCIGANTVAEFPELTERLAAIDVTKNLQRALQAGVFDEYGWEALDNAANIHPLKQVRNHYSNSNFEVFPYFSFQSDGEVVIVGPASSNVYPLVLSKGEELNFVIPVGQDAVMVTRNEVWESKWKWLSQPQALGQKYDQGYYYRENYIIIQLSDGDWFAGGRAMRAGDETLPTLESSWFSDGKRIWKLDTEMSNWHYYQAENKGDENRCREIDPQTGKAIRESVPPFFERDIPAGSQILWAISYMLPAPPSDGKSPLGTSDGLIGWRVVRRRDGSVEGTGIDGRKAVIPQSEQPAAGFLAPIALMDKPAAEGFWLVSSLGFVIDQATNIPITDISSGTTRYHAGQPTQLKSLFLHLMRLRHEPSSAKLRQTDSKTVAQLHTAAIVEHEAKKLKEDPDKPDANRTAAESFVQEWLSEAPPRLVTGVAKLAEVAALEQISLQKMVERCRKLDSSDAEASAKAQAKAAIMERAHEGFAQLGLRENSDIRVLSYDRGGEYDDAKHISEVAKFLAGDTVESLPPTTLPWFEMLKDPVAVAYNCFWKTATNTELAASVGQRIKTPWLDALRAYSDSGMLKMYGELCLYVETRDADVPNATPKKQDSFASKLSSKSPIPFCEGDSRYVGYLFECYPLNTIVVLERATKGKPKPPKGMLVERTIPVPKSWSTGYMRAFIEAVEKLEEIPFPDPKDIDDAATELGMHPIAVALMFMGNLRTTRYGQDKLTKEIRDFFNWKVKDIQEAIAQLDASTPPANVGCEFARHNPSDALGSKRSMAVRRMVMAWKGSQEPSLTIPAELAKVLEKTNQVHGSLSNSHFTELISNPENARALAPRTATVSINKRRTHEQLAVNYQPAFGVNPDQFFYHLARSISITSYSLPSGHVLRRQIPKLILASRKLLDNPDTMLPFGGSYSQFDGYADVQVDEPIGVYSSLVGKMEKDGEGIYKCDDGFISVNVAPPHVVCLFRTANLKSEQALKRIQAVAAATYQYQQSAEAAINAALSVLMFRSDSFDRLIAANETSAVPAGRWDQDPRLSCPKLVDKVAKVLGVGTEATTLYLQLLALPDPTAKNVRQWNEWSAKQLASASDELISCQLVVQAKRPRAGRDIFLPGGWENLALPNLPIESWKLPLYGYQSVEAFRGYFKELIVCQDTLESLFENAWRRVESGDSPRYEEAQIQRGRKK